MVEHALEVGQPPGQPLRGEGLRRSDRRVLLILVVQHGRDGVVRVVGLVGDVADGHHQRASLSPLRGILRREAVPLGEVRTDVGHLADRVALVDEDGGREHGKPRFRAPIAHLGVGDAGFFEHEPDVLAAPRQHAPVVQRVAHRAEVYASELPGALGIIGGAMTVRSWGVSVALAMLALACGKSGTEAPPPAEVEAADEAPQPAEPPEVAGVSGALESFGSATEVDAFVKERAAARRGGAIGQAYGAGGLGLVGTGMGGGGTGEGTIGLGNLGLIGKGGGSGHFLASPAAQPDGVTNTQEENVDEGGIVKVHGDHLVVLRRGRLFTVKVGDGALNPVDGVNVGSKRKHQAWYDELLIHGDEIIVVGFSYEFGATELARFSISASGKLRHTVTDYLRSNDYYSSRNYASRLIGDTLVFYMPHRLAGSWPTKAGDATGVPAMCSPTRGKCSTWTGIVEATRVYKPLVGGPASVLHTVVTCDLSKGAEAMRCRGRGVLGPYARNFYVAEDAVYIWVNDPTWTPPPPWSPRAAETPTDAVVYRLGLKDDSVAAIRSFGAPVDQFSFKESASGHLNVLVRAQGAGGGMWGAELGASHDVALFRAPLGAFEAGQCAASEAANYVDLPDPKGHGYAFHNRFVGDTLLYGVGAGWGRPAEGKSPLFVHRLGDEETSTLKLSHPIDRIEPMGTHAVVVGASANDLEFAAIALGEKAKTAGTFVQENANQGETRSHGFFFRQTAEQGGMLGLPILRGGGSTTAQLGSGSAEVLYLDVEDLKFERLGTLKADPKAGRRDRCEVSCVDWYGNARPLFIGDRVLALLGYEVVEGIVDGDNLGERRRVNMLPALRGR